jgi:acyl carrier protein
MIEKLIPEVKQMIIDSLRIEGMAAEDIETDAPLFGEGLGLDSIDPCNWLWRWKRTMVL